jgi:hypothetical protein
MKNKARKTKTPEPKTTPGKDDDDVDGLADDVVVSTTRSRMTKGSLISESSHCAVPKKMSFLGRRLLPQSSFTLSVKNLRSPRWTRNRKLVLPSRRRQEKQNLQKLAPT